MSRRHYDEILDAIRRLENAPHALASIASIDVHLRDPGNVESGTNQRIPVSVRPIVSDEAASDAENIAYLTRRFAEQSPEEGRRLLRLMQEVYLATRAASANRSAQGDSGGSNAPSRSTGEAPGVPNPGNGRVGQTNRNEGMQEGGANADARPIPSIEQTQTTTTETKVPTLPPAGSQREGSNRNAPPVASTKPFGTTKTNTETPRQGVKQSHSGAGVGSTAKPGKIVLLEDFRLKIQQKAHSSAPKPENRHAAEGSRQIAKQKEQAIKTKADQDAAALAQLIADLKAAGRRETDEEGSDGSVAGSTSESKQQKKGRANSSKSTKKPAVSKPSAKQETKTTARTPAPGDNIARVATANAAGPMAPPPLPSPRRRPSPSRQSTPNDQGSSQARPRASSTQVPTTPTNATTRRLTRSHSEAQTPLKHFTRSSGLRKQSSSEAPKSQTNPASDSDDFVPKAKHWGIGTREGVMPNGPDNECALKKDAREKRQAKKAAAEDAKRTASDAGMDSPSDHQAKKAKAQDPPDDRLIDQSVQQTDEAPTPDSFDADSDSDDPGDPKGSDDDDDDDDGDAGDYDEPWNFGEADDAGDSDGLGSSGGAIDTNAAKNPGDSRNAVDENNNHGDHADNDDRSSDGSESAWSQNGRKDRRRRLTLKVLIVNALKGYSGRNQLFDVVLSNLRRSLVKLLKVRNEKGHEVVQAGEFDWAVEKLIAEGRVRWKGKTRRMRRLWLPPPDEDHDDHPEQVPWVSLPDFCPEDFLPPDDEGDSGNSSDDDDDEDGHGPHHPRPEKDLKVFILKHADFNPDNEEPPEKKPKNANKPTQKTAKCKS